MDSLATAVNRPWAIVFRGKVLTLLTEDKHRSGSDVVGIVIIILKSVTTT